MHIHAAIKQTFIYAINNCGDDAYMNSKKWGIKRKDSFHQGILN